ncbi:MAG: hypothetical protein JNM27_06320 [Leptospirales bacterium]|nr:hypothetical protein [Leptospirales bacterium]
MKLCVALTLFATSLSAQSIYKTPGEVIDGAVITRLENELAGQNPDLPKIIGEGEAELARYNSQFIADKRIQDERRGQHVALSENAIRLMALSRSKEAGRNYFLGDHPYLFRLHRLIGESYDRSRDRYRALNQYAMAFRFTSLEQPYVETLSENDRHARYIQILNGFANEDRLSEERDPQAIADARSFRTDLSQYTKVSADAEEARKQIAGEEARIARGQPGDPAAARAKFEQLSAQKKALEQRLENVRTTSYKKYATEKQKRDGDLAFLMAVLVQQLEGKNKEIDRILNRSSFYRGIGTELGEDRTPYREFTAYGMVLELANKIDPSNISYVTLLANEYKRSRQVPLALRYFQDYFDLADKLPQRPGDYDANLLTYAGLYTDSQNYIRASELLEKYVKNVNSPQVRLQLADISFQRTGKLERAKELYEQFLSAQPPLDQITDTKKRTESALVRYRVHKNLAAIARRSLRTEQELASLQASEGVFRTVEKDFAAARQAEDTIRSKLFEIKQKVISREDEDLQREYYRLQRIDLTEAAEVTGYIRTRLDSMNFGLVLERQAYLAERARDFNTAGAKYREMVLRGTGPEQTRARENLERIRLTLADGMLRSPVLAPDFER